MDLAVGLIVVFAGLALVIRPFTSVSLLLFVLGLSLIIAGIAELLHRQTGPRRSVWFTATLATGLMILGLAILLLPALTLRMIILLVALALVVHGIRDVIMGIIEREQRWAQLLGGSASVIFGVLALTWRDVTVLVLGAIFGLWLALFGVRMLLSTITDTRSGITTAAKVRTLVWPRVALSALSLTLAVLLAFAGNALIGKHSPDEFYAAPAVVPTEPGKLLRAEAFTQQVPDGSTGWRILYTTTRGEGEPAIASGIVVVPDGVAEAPIVAWAHGTTGGAVSCAPSLLADPFVAGALMNASEVLDAGWAIVATDYIGLGADAPHMYMVGQPAARSVLDAVRAAQQLQEASLGTQVAVWGHSQGGGAALWAGGVAVTYAPELDIVGVAAMAPAANLPAMIGQLADEAAGTVVGPLVLSGFAARYDDVRVTDYLHPTATLMFQETNARCWSDPSMIVSLLGAAAIDRPIWSAAPTSGPLADRLEENVPRLPIPAPLLIAQGDADTLVLPEGQQAYVDSLHTAGQEVDYRTYEGKDHMGVVSAGSPLRDELMLWTAARFAGE